MWEWGVSHDSLVLLVAVFIQVLLLVLFLVLLLLAPRVLLLSSCWCC